jgi:hypothetical protein
VDKVTRIKNNVNEKNTGKLKKLYFAGDPIKNESLLAELKKISGLTIVPM